MKDTFRKSIHIPVDFTLTDEPSPNVICAAECYITDYIKDNNIVNKFFGKLKDKVSKMTVVIDSSLLRLTCTFDKSVKSLEKEIEAQLNFIAYNIIRAELQYTEIPFVKSKIIFPGSIPHTFYKRNTYMEALDFPTDSYGVNFVSADDHRRPDWDTQLLLHGFDDRETWNMPILFVEWLYSHLKRYLEVTIVDIEAEKYTFTVWDENNDPQTLSMNMKEAAEIIIAACEDYLKNGEMLDAQKYFHAKQRMTYALRLWAELFPAFWW